MKLRGLGDTVKMAALAGRRGPAEHAEGYRSGARKRKDRGRRAGVARCQVVMGLVWENARGEVVVNPADTSGLTRVEYRCGFGLVARHGSARCPAHGSRTVV